MKRRDAIKSVGGGLSLKWTAPVVVSVLLPQHAQASGGNTNFAANVKFCEMSEGLVTAEITLTNTNRYTVNIDAISVDKADFLFPVVPMSLAAGQEMAIPIGGSVLSTEYHCQVPSNITLTVIGTTETGQEFACSISVS